MTVGRSQSETSSRHPESSAVPDNTSTLRHNESLTPQRQPKLWIPFALRRLTLATFILFFILLMIAFAILFGISNRNQGLATANPNWYYLWVYGPTTAFTLIAAFWVPVEYRAKQIQPWVLMAGNFRPVQDSLLLDYIDRLSFIGLFVSLRRRHWLAFCGIAAGFAIITATVVSSGLLVSSSLLVQRDDVQLVATENFSVKKMPRAGSRPAMNVYGALDSHIPFPTGTVDQYAFQWFRSLDGIAYDNLTAVVDVFEAVLDCEVATIAPGDQAEAGKNTLPATPTQTNGGVVYADYYESRLILKSPSCPNPLYLSVVGEFGPKNFAFNGSSCGDMNATAGSVGAIDRFVAVWGNWETSGIEAEYFPSLGLVCVPSYSIRKGSLRLSRENTAGVLRPYIYFPNNAVGATTTLDSITPWDILTEFVRTTVESTDSIFMGDSGSFGGAFYTGLEYLTETAISKGHADDRKAALSKIFGLVTAQLANQYLKEAAQVSLGGTTAIRESRLVVSPVSFWLLEAMLLILCLLAGYLIVVSPKLSASCDTSTLAGLSAVLARSEPVMSKLEETGKVSTKSLANLLKTIEFRTEVSLDNNQPIFRIGCITAEDTNSLQSKSDSDEENSADGRSHWRRWPHWKPWTLRLPARKCFRSVQQWFQRRSSPSVLSRRKPLPDKVKEECYQPFTVTVIGRVLMLAAFPALILTLELLYRRSSRNDGLAEISDNSNVAHYAWTYTPTAVMVGMGLWLVALSSTVKLLGPFYSLWRGRASAEDTMTENYLRSIAIVAIWNATRKKRWGVAAAGLASILARFLTIVASGLLATGPSLTRNVADFQPVNSFNLTSAPIGTGLTYANLALASNLSDPLWLYQDLVFPKLVSLNSNALSTRSTAADISEGEPSTTKVTFEGLPAVRSTFNCTPATPEYLACANGSVSDHMFVGDIGQSLKYHTASDTFSGYFGRMTPFRYNIETGIYALYDDVTFPLCPTTLVVFGHATNLIVDETSRLACWPYVEEVPVSATFRLPSWELDVSASSPPVAVTQKNIDTTNVLPSEDDFIFLSQLSTLVFSNPAGVDPSLDLDGFFGLAINGRNGTPVAELNANIGNLQRAVESTFRVIMAQFLNNARTHLKANDTRPTFTGRVTTPNAGHLRLYQSAISTRILEGLLGVMFVCVVIAYLTQRHMAKLLPKSPCSIGAGASLLAGSDLLRHMPAGAEWMTDEERSRLEIFQRCLFGLGPWALTESSGEEVGGVRGDRDGEENEKWFGIDFEWADGRRDSLS
ncbi:hypothetical protein B0H66DRAFT_608608 [Apodospora peruviana]|uniref:Uncharacterized protein n=1 Tax=Apodospora peruviana TaxID=516989 RepID=A0AAE0HSY9_9PEZI|nr:hypothetical protein B0H66DRAFT_608608 [Apodospora peruviana]